MFILILNTNNINLSSKIYEQNLQNKVITATKFIKQNSLNNELFLFFIKTFLK